MDIRKAKKILELPEKYTEAELKKQYHIFAMKYHPDKNKNENAKDKFMEIQEAYEFLNQPQQPENFKVVDTIFSTFLKSFNKNFNVPETKKVKITAKEYLTGTVKSINIQEKCCCEKKLCLHCAGSGFCLGNLAALTTCEYCLGDGYYQHCPTCDGGFIKKQVDIHIPAKTMKFNIQRISLIVELENPYFVKESQLYYPFEISLKESLTGVSKHFKDPFGVTHKINTKKIIQTNDGYRVGNIILLFKVIYPKNLKIIEQLKEIDF